MKQAEILTAVEYKRLPAVIASVRHSEKSRLAVMLSPLAGLCVG
jgi:integrase/recombinase XerD